MRGRARRIEERVARLGRDLVARFAEAEARIHAVFTSSVARSPSRGSVRARTSEISSVLAAVDSYVRNEVPSFVEDAFSLGRDLSDAHEWTLPFDVDSSFTYHDREAVDILSDNLLAQLGEATTTVGRRIDDVFRRVGLRSALETYASTQVPSTVNSAAFEAQLRKQGVTAFVDKRNRPWTLHDYAEMAIRTTRAEAANQGVANRMLSRGFVLYRVSNPEKECRICEPYVGKIWSLVPGVVVDGEEVPVADRLAPYHPRCHCFNLPDEASVLHRLVPA